MTYEGFLRSRGIHDLRIPALYLTQGILLCWFEPGFHRFWQRWNPPVAYLTFRLYSVVRRTRRMRIPATISVFLAMGMVHDLVGIAVIGQFTLKSTSVFLFFGVFSVMSRWMQPALQQRRWPRTLNMLMNAALAYVSFRGGDLLSAALAV